MPRYYEIEPAFWAAMEIEPNGRRTVTTERFVQQLHAVKWDWTLKQANDWIEASVSTFKDISEQEGENRTFMMFNPNGGL